MNRPGNAQVHRFHDRVALSLPGAGETVYLEPKEAAKLARALSGGARNIKAQKFVDSDFGTVEIPLNGNPLFKQVRK